VSSVEALKDKLKEAIEQAIASSRKRKFKQSVELVVVFKDANPKAPEFKFRDAIYMPKGLGKPSKVCVVADGDMLINARKAGADLVLSKEDVQKMDRKSAKKIAQMCDWVLVRADLMPIAGRILGPALGPRGKAPTPIPMNANIEDLIKRYRNTTRFRNKEQPFVSGKIGSEDMSVDDLVENAIAALTHIENKIKRPLIYSSRIYIKTTMGPSIEVLL